MFHLLLRYWIATWRSRCFDSGSVYCRSLPQSSPGTPQPPHYPGREAPCTCNRYRGLQNGAKGYLGKGTIMHKLVLKRFQVKNFRNIENSDWIPVERVTCFVGRNEFRQDCLAEGNIQAESRQP